MNTVKKTIVAATLMLALGGSLAACTGGQPDADVLQYGYYTPAHVYVVYPTPHVVHVSYKVYHSNTTMYSNPSVEKTYVTTHTSTHTTTSVNKAPGRSNGVSLSKTTTSRTTTTHH